MNQKAIEEIGKRIGQKDFICIIAGRCQEMITHAFPGHVSVEWGIGYSGIFAKYRVFESYAWMHHLHGVLKSDDMRYFDAVIPNSFRISDFPLGKGDGVLLVYWSSSSVRGRNSGGNPKDQCKTRHGWAGARRVGILLRIGS
jgi:hypothetical protein